MSAVIRIVECSSSSITVRKLLALIKAAPGPHKAGFTGRPCRRTNRILTASVLPVQGGLDGRRLPDEEIRYLALEPLRPVHLPIGPQVDQGQQQVRHRNRCRGRPSRRPLWPLQIREGCDER